MSNYYIIQPSTAITKFSKQREVIVPRRLPKVQAPDIPLAPMTWIQRLKRVFAIDIQTCPK
ncbi:MAG: hypothetical protein VYE04_10850 [Pseudomonadota bacterium]|nr:hypothetical protein [Pseudomonadota bacterium]